MVKITDFEKLAKICCNLITIYDIIYDNFAGTQKTKSKHSFFSIFFAL